MTEVPEVVIENAEMANDDEIVNPTKTKKEIDAMKNPVANAVKTKDKKKVIKGLHVDNVVVVYKDEIGRIDKLRFSFDCPLVDESWLPLAARKMLSLHLESENILPTQILSVSLPAQGGKEIEIKPTFLKFTPRRLESVIIIINSFVIIISTTGGIYPNSNIAS